MQSVIKRKAIIPHLNLSVELYPRKIRIEFLLRLAVKVPHDVIRRLFGSNKNKCARMGVFIGG
jgi:hypothetical protein